VTLSVPRQYTALAGDLLVTFSTNDEATPLNDTDTWYIDVIESRDPREEEDDGYLSEPLTTVDIPGGYSDAEVNIGCGVIDAAGQLVVRLIDSTTADVVAQSSVIQVSWPTSVKLRLPDSHRALTEDLVVRLSVGADVLCKTEQPDVSYSLQLIYLGLNQTSSTFVDTSQQKSRVIYGQTLRSLSSVDLTVPCSLIDRAGFYQATLLFSRRPDLPLAVSNTVVVAWSRAYSLSLLSGSACRSTAVLRHTQPRCDGASYTLRVLVRRRRYNDNNYYSYVVGRGGVDDVTRGSRDWRHVTERRVTSSETSSTLDCADVAPRHDAGQHLEHCAVLLSTASDDSEHVHQRVCTTHSNPHRGQSSVKHASIYFTHAVVF